MICLEFSGTYSQHKQHITFEEEPFIFLRLPEESSFLSQLGLNHDDWLRRIAGMAYRIIENSDARRAHVLVTGATEKSLHCLCFTNLGEITPIEVKPYRRADTSIRITKTATPFSMNENAEKKIQEKLGELRQQKKIHSQEIKEQKMKREEDAFFAMRSDNLVQVEVDNPLDIPDIENFNDNTTEALDTLIKAGQLPDEYASLWEICEKLKNSTRQLDDPQASIREVIQKHFAHYNKQQHAKNVAAIAIHNAGCESAKWIMSNTDGQPENRRKWLQDLNELLFGYFRVAPLLYLLPFDEFLGPRFASMTSETVARNISALIKTCKAAPNKSLMVSSPEFGFLLGSFEKTNQKYADFLKDEKDEKDETQPPLFMDNTQNCFYIDKSNYQFKWNLTCMKSLDTPPAANTFLEPETAIQFYYSKKNLLKNYLELAISKKVDDFCQRVDPEKSLSALYNETLVFMITAEETLASNSETDAHAITCFELGSQLQSKIQSLVAAIQTLCVKTEMSIQEEAKQITQAIDSLQENLAKIFANKKFDCYQGDWGSLDTSLRERRESMEDLKKQGPLCALIKPVSTRGPEKQIEDVCQQLEKLNNLKQAMSSSRLRELTDEFQTQITDSIEKLKSERKRLADAAIEKSRQEEEEKQAELNRTHQQHLEGEAEHALNDIRVLLQNYLDSLAAREPALYDIWYPQAILLEAARPGFDGVVIFDKIRLVHRLMSETQPQQAGVSARVRFASIARQMADEQNLNILKTHRNGNDPDPEGICCSTKIWHIIRNAFRSITSVFYQPASRKLQQAAQRCIDHAIEDTPQLASPVPV